jgi:hypothetical protein
MTRRRHLFIATCTGCATTIQFPEPLERDEWAAHHEQLTGHTVARSEEWRDVPESRAEDPGRFTPEPDPAPDPEALLCVGGPKHGEQVTLPADQTSWLDLATAQTYRRQWFLAGTDNPLTGRPTRMWRRAALVWEGIGSPSDAVMQLANWLYGKWCEQGGDQVDTAELSPPIKPSNGGQPQ